MGTLSNAPSALKSDYKVFCNKSIFQNDYPDWGSNPIFREKRP